MQFSIISGHTVYERPVKTQIILSIRLIESKFLLCNQLIVKDIGVGWGRGYAGQTGFN